MSICEHVDMPDTALQVVPQRPPRGVAVRCPCCGLSGWLDLDDPRPLRCPYCFVAAVQAHTRAYAGHGPDDGDDRGAYCVECSRDAEDYVWPCAVLAGPTDQRSNQK